MVIAFFAAGSFACLLLGARRLCACMDVAFFAAPSRFPYPSFYFFYVSSAGYHAGWVPGMEEVWDKNAKANH